MNTALARIRSITFRSMIWFRSTSIEPLLLQAGPHPPGRLVGLPGDRGDFRVVIVFVGVDLLVFGDPLEDEVLLQGPGGRGAAVLPQHVLVGANFLLAETAPLQLHDRPLQLAMALPLQEVGRQLPVGGHGQRGGDLLAGPLPLLILQALAERVLDRVAEVGLELEPAQFLQQFRGQFRQLQLS